MFSNFFPRLCSLSCATTEISILLSTQSASDMTETSLNIGDEKNENETKQKNTPISPNICRLALSWEPPLIFSSSYDSALTFTTSSHGTQRSTRGTSPLKSFPNISGPAHTLDFQVGVCSGPSKL